MGRSSPYEDERNRRFYLGLKPPEKRSSRSPSQRDRDRLVYTSALRRLAGVTQVVGPLEGHVFHNRLTHTLKVAQIAKRLAERLQRGAYAKARGGIDPEVVEAAALAHDLGHPPFGHVAENELDRLVRKSGDEEGYEGNAQSFRIVTLLASHSPGYGGLDLTRATLNAILKYPWRRNLSDTESRRYHKFGFYSSEVAHFEFARGGFRDDRQSIEAAIMDVADSIAYSVHDLDDFYRAGLVPLTQLRYSEIQLGDFLSEWQARTKDLTLRADIPTHRRALQKLLEFWPTDRQYAGTAPERKILKWTTSQLIDRYVRAVRVRKPDLGEKPLHLPRSLEVELEFLQEIVRRYVISNPRLATQQAGHRKIVRYLYLSYNRAILNDRFDILPTGFHERAADVSKVNGDSVKRRLAARIAADVVASLSDSQAQLLYRRLDGVTMGSISDILDG